MHTCNASCISVFSSHTFCPQHFWQEIEYKCFCPKNFLPLFCFLFTGRGILSGGTCDLFRAEWELKRGKEARESWWLFTYSLVRLLFTCSFLLSGVSLDRGLRTVGFLVLCGDSPSWAKVRTFFFFFFWTSPKLETLKGRGKRWGQEERRRRGEGDKKAGGVTIKWCF